MNGITIRKTTDADGAQLVRLGNAVWRTTYAHIFPKEVFEDKDAKAAEKIATFKSGNDEEGKLSYVAEADGRIVAFANAGTLSGYDHYKAQGYADLWAIYIDPTYQHAGLGKMLFDKITHDLRAMGCTKMVIGVLKENAKARKAYEKWGGVLDSHEQPFVKLDVGYPEVFYLYDLKKGAK